MPDKPLEHQEIVRLLAKLKEDTPEYPADLLEARKYSYLKQIVDLKISAEGQQGGQKGGKAGPGGAGGVGGATGGGATFLGLPLKTALAIGAAILMLTAGYLFRDQIVEVLADNGLITTEETAAPPFASTPGSPGEGTPTAFEAPTFELPSSGGAATQATPGSGNNDPGGPTAPPEQGGPASIFEYLLCVLRSGTESCR